MTVEYSTLELDASGDITFNIATNVEGIAQRIRTSLRLEQGSSLYDLQAGFPWTRVNESQNNVLLDGLLRRHILLLPLVTRILSLIVDRDEINRRLTVSTTIETTAGEAVAVTFNTV